MNSKRSTALTPQESSRSSSCTASGSSPAAGTTGASSLKNAAIPRSRQVGPMTRRPSKRIKQVTDHYADAIRQLKTRPAVVGHSFGGLIAQQLADEGLSAVTVAIDAAGFRGVLPLPLSERGFVG